MDRRSTVAALAASLTMAASAGPGDAEPWKPLGHFTHSPVKVTFAGTSTLLFEDETHKVLIDGFFTRPGFLRVAFGQLRTNPCEVEYALDQLRVEKLDVVAVAHSHYDHAMDSATVAACTGATLFGSESTLKTAAPGQETEKYLHGVAKEYGAFKVTPYKSRHSPMFPIIDNLGEEIVHALTQPVHQSEYKEGGSYDLLIEHKGLRLLVTPSASFDPHVAPVPAHIVFLGVGALAKQSPDARIAYFNHAVDKERTELIVPIHSDYFFKSLRHGLERMPRLLDDVDTAIAFVKESAGNKRVVELEAFQTLHMNGKPEKLAPAGRRKGEGNCRCKPRGEGK